MEKWKNERYKKISKVKKKGSQREFGSRRKKQLWLATKCLSLCVRDKNDKLEEWDNDTKR